MNVTMIGAGYVGLVTGACFSEFGFDVTCVDIDEKKIESLKNGEIPIYEPGLESLVKSGTEKKRLLFTSNIHDAVSEADVIMIAVGTPSRRGDGHADLSYVYSAAEEIAKSLKKYAVIVTKSTVPVGTARKVKEIIQRTRPSLVCGVDYDVASNPEFLREGSAIGDFMRPDRVVIGTDSRRAQAMLEQLYRPLYLIETPIIATGIESAELIKYASNAFLAVKIAYINQLSDLCEKVDANVQDVAKGMGLDNRIGKKFLNVGPGYGGSCFPKDTLALVKTAQDHETPITIVEAVVESNLNRKKSLAARAIERLKALNAESIAILGITFKPNTDDMRDAPSLIIIPELVKAGFNVNVYDPLYFKNAARVKALGPEFSGIQWCESAYDAAEGTSLIMILTEWNEFRGLDFEKLKKVMNKGQANILDYRNIYKEKDVIDINYESLGRDFSKLST